MGAAPPNTEGESYGTTEHPPAERGLRHLLFQRHLHHFQRCGGQPAAGRIRFCLRHDRHPAQPAEHRQPAGGPAGRCAGGKNGHEAKRPAADHRLCGGLRPDGPDRPAHSAGAGFLHCGHCQGQCPEYLHHPCQRQLFRPHPGHEHHARLLRLRCPALPLSDLCRGQGQHHAGRAGTGGAGSGALAGIPVHPHGRPCQGQRSCHRLELFALLPLLAAHRPAVLPERRRAERCGLDGHLLQGQRHHCRHAGGLYRHRDVGCHPDRPPAHRFCVPTQTAP